MINDFKDTYISVLSKYYYCRHIFEFKLPLNELIKYYYCRHVFEFKLPLNEEILE